MPTETMVMNIAEIQVTYRQAYEIQLTNIKHYYCKTTHKKPYTVLANSLTTSKRNICDTVFSSTGT